MAGRGHAAAGGVVGVDVVVAAAQEIAPGYSAKISRPMCIERMEEKAAHGYYRNSQQMREDFELMILNCLNYNAKVPTYLLPSINEHTSTPAAAATVAHAVWLLPMSWC